ncbi:MAG: hypothetical protein A4E71_02701 [Smithella sp. PtaU1.Bin162]|nr:MAG: hypothetical protein A4E71_02701 [Smithella sp. PtaU1.Bin162]
MFNAGADNIIGIPQQSVFIYSYLGNDKAGKSFGSFGMTFDSRQYYMNHIFTKIVVTAGDENFSAFYFVSTVGILDRLGAHRSYVAAGLGFG